MNIENQAKSKVQKETIKNTSTLPFKGEAGYYKIVGIIALLIFVIALNYIFLHKANSPETESKEETYNTTTANPMTKPAISTSSDAVQQKSSEEESNKLLQQKIAAAKAQDFIDRLQAPQSAGGNSSNNTTQPTTIDNPTETRNNATLSSYSQDSNTAFLLQASNSKAQREYATHFGLLPYVIGQGKFIFGTLAVAINSDLPGQIEAVVSQDVYGEQGNKVLIPRGSHLIGEYKSGLVNNQSRLFTVWTRIKEPNGIDIQLGSEGTDALGRAGLTGRVDYHFVDRFGSALLISMIGTGAATVGVNSADQYNSAAIYRTGIAEAMSEQGRSMLSQNINIPPTINIPQGEKVVVFVNRDLDFSRVYR